MIAANQKRLDRGVFRIVALISIVWVPGAIWLFWPHDLMDYERYRSKAMSEFQCRAIERHTSVDCDTFRRQRLGRVSEPSPECMRQTTNPYDCILQTWEESGVRIPYEEPDETQRMRIEISASHAWVKSRNAAAVLTAMLYGFLPLVVVWLLVARIAPFALRYVREGFRGQ